MALFKRNISEELSAELHGLVDDYTENLLDYEFISEKIERREDLSEGLLFSAGLTLATALPVGMMLGSAYMDNITSGGAIGAILPMGLGLGAGLISYLNHKDNKELTINQELDKPMQSKHNEKAGQEFLQQLSEFDVGEAFNDIKEIVDASVKNPPKFQENIGMEVRNVLIKNKM
jgi:hypothetical protein